MRKNPLSVIELLTCMVSFDSINEYTSGVNFPEQAMLEFLEDIAQDWGLETTRLPIASHKNDQSYNLLITYGASAKLPWLVFESHADTVSVDGMSIEPFKAVIKDGRIYGRGVCDTKGSGSGMLWALRDYAQQSVKANNIALLFVTDEESSKTGATAFAHFQLSNLPWKPLGIFVGEPTSCKPVVAHNGVIRWKIRTRGLAAHSSDPSKGISAISAMAKLIVEFEREYCSVISLNHPLTGIAACSVNTISGGIAVNIIPNTCEIEIDRRTLPGEDSAQVLLEMKGILDAIAQKDPSIVIETSPPFIDHQLDPNVNHEIANRVSQILTDMGLPGTHSGAGYGTDASTYSAVGIPALVLGPGNVEQAHTKDEWLEIDELEKAVLVYLQIMKSAF
jgi:acetylornithine deacetylase